MAQRPDDLTLDGGLIKKGEARGLDPAVAAPPQPEGVPTRRSSPAHAAPLTTNTAPPRPPLAQDDDGDDPPLRAVPPDDVPKRFTSFRLPVELDEDLRNMAFVTRRSKQDLLIEAVTELVGRWKRDRVRRTG
jgi:hypothetical protein